MPLRSMFVLLASGALAAGLLSGCSPMSEITSTWNEGTNARVDGSGKGWSGALWDLSDDRVSVGVKNDREYLYLCMMTADRARIGQVLSGGLTWWINPDGSKEKSYGIRFPVGGMSRSFMAALRGNQENEGGQLPTLDEAQKEFEVVRGKMQQHVSVAEGQGVLARVGYDEGRLVCELRVPMESSAAHPYAVGTMPSGDLALGLETERVEAGGGGQPPRGEGGEGGGEGGGMRGGRGGRGGMRGGGGFGRGGGRGNTANAGPLDTWLKVGLAQPSH